MGLDESRVATAVLLLISSGLVLGLSALPAAFVITACAGLLLARISSHPVLPLPAIRGYLWGRAMHEGLASPVIGSGFGRCNSILHVFAALGILGLANLTALLASLWRPLRRNCGDDLWAHVGLTSLIGLVLMSITQHAFGEPIFGLSLFCMVGISCQLSGSKTTGGQPLVSDYPSTQSERNSARVLSQTPSAQLSEPKVVVT